MTWRLTLTAQYTVNGTRADAELVRHQLHERLQREHVHPGARMTYRAETRIEYAGSGNMAPPANSRTAIVVCGLPGSGNRFLSEFLKHAGARTKIMHGNQDMTRQLVTEMGATDPDTYLRAVMPVRHNPIRLDKNEPRIPEMSDWTARTIRVLSYLQIPLRVVSYEAMFLYPESFRRDLLEWCGLRSDIPWHDEPVDANEKYGALGKAMVA